MKSALKKTGRCIIVTGLSGAGKHQVLYQLEDLGWFCVDNFPVPLIPGGLACLREKIPATDLAIGLDVRGGDLKTFYAAVAELKKQYRDVRVLFLEATEAELLRRFSETRRAHPLRGKLTLTEQIRREGEQLKGLRNQADVVLDTSRLGLPELKRRLGAWLQKDPSPLQITLSSFGFKYGFPTDADMMLDVRFLPNPFYVASLKTLNGRSAAVRRYVLKSTLAREAVERIALLVECVIPGFSREGKSALHVAVGCTGGQHRSVVVVEHLQKRLGAYPVTVIHRELGASGRKRA